MANFGSSLLNQKENWDYTKLRKVFAKNSVEKLVARISYKKTFVVWFST